MPTRRALNGPSSTNVPTEPEAELARAANLGPKSAAVLVRVGVPTLAELRQFGAVKVYCMAKEAEPSVTLNLLWALEGAILGQCWQVVAKEHRTSLLLALEDYRNRAFYK